jgi:CPA2 family monovalent cation:H+ antiporter-2
MPHDVSLIATIAVGFAVAFFCGFLANRLRLPPLVGYLLAGVVVGPFSPGFVADSGLAGQLAEIGVMLLMFGVGLHFSLADLMAVRRIAIPGAVAQIVVATLIGAGMAMLWGWRFGSGLVLGLSLSVASTVVMLKAMEERAAVDTPNGRIAIGWLIVEDLAMVLSLVLLPALAEVLGGHAADGAHGTSSRGLAVTIGLTLAKVAAFIATVLLVGPRILPPLLRQVARTGSRELFTLAVLAIALGIAFGSAKLFGVSFALGAFFAGMVLNESSLSHKAATNVLPLQDAFAVLFFVSVGMLFDPSVVVRQPLMVAGVVALILVGKSLVALGIVLFMGYPLSTALVVSASLAQIGEFSFILAGLGLAHGLLTAEGLNLVLAGALFSITLNPLVFAAADRACQWVRGHPRSRQRFEESRQARFAALENELVAAREAAAAKAAAHKTFTPEELLERFPLFTGLSPEQREVLVLHFETRSAQPGERLIRRGEKPDVVYFIAEGQVEVSVAGQRITLGPGDHFGEMALINDQPRSADVTALDFSKFVTLDQRDFRQFLRRFPEIREKVTALAAARGERNRHWLDGEADAQSASAAKQ